MPIDTPESRPQPPTDEPVLPEQRLTPGRAARSNPSSFPLRPVPSLTRSQLLCLTLSGLGLLPRFVRRASAAPGM